MTSEKKLFPYLIKMPNPLHYPDLTRCQELTKLGFPRTQMSWRLFSVSEPNIIFSDENTDGNIEYACPSVSEMLDVMPSSILDWYDLCIARNWPTSKYYITSYTKWHGMYCHFLGTLPNALADLVKWLVENNYLTFPNHE